MSAINFIPLLLATLGLVYTSFKAKGKKKTWLIVAFIIWLVVFVFTILMFK